MSLRFRFWSFIILVSALLSKSILWNEIKNISKFPSYNYNSNAINNSALDDNVEFKIYILILWNIISVELTNTFIGLYFKFYVFGEIYFNFSNFFSCWFEQLMKY